MSKRDITYKHEYLPPLPLSKLEFIIYYTFL